MVAVLSKPNSVFALVVGFVLTYLPVHAQEPQLDDSKPATADQAKPKSESPVVTLEPVVVVVTASRGPVVGDAPVATTVLTAEQIANTPAQTSDQLLRDIPVVALPRNDSHSLHPTGQSISIRGVGRGRTLVLANGVPLNDPFGGWVHWNKIPLSEIDRAEVVRGATSNLYGSLAMAGVVQYLTTPTERNRFYAQTDGGSFNSYHSTLVAAGTLTSSLSGSLYGDIYRTDGYNI